MPGAKQPSLRLRLSAAAEAAVRSGHPWVFDEGVKEQNRQGQTGELAIIYDRRDRFLAIGLFDPASPIRLRVLHTGKPQTIDREWWAARLKQALQRRHGLFDDLTTGYRCINGESDGWPGFVLDRFDSTFVLKLYTASWLPWLEEILGLILEQLRPERVVLRLSRNVGGAGSLPDCSPCVGTMNKEGLRLRGRFTERGLGGSTGGPLHGILIGPPLAGPVTFLESGLKFEADVLHGQKTGFFLDQRENRRKVEALAAGRRVLNAFSFTGGFSVYAARGGAVEVTDVDISRHSLGGAKRNFALNQSLQSVRDCRHETIQADAFDWLAANTKRRFDLVILDPPSLAKRQSEKHRAIAAYAKLIRLGMKSLSPGGILLACSCSAHVTSDEFFAAARQAAASSGRKFIELQTTGHTTDHPATFKEAHYLKAIFFRLD